MGNYAFPLHQVCDPLSQSRKAPPPLWNGKTAPPIYFVRLTLQACLQSLPAAHVHYAQWGLFHSATQRQIERGHREYSKRHGELDKNGRWPRTTPRYHRYCHRPQTSARRRYETHRQQLTIQPLREVLLERRHVTDLPNASFVVGYVDASCTLGADATATLVCRILKRMRKEGIAVVVPSLE